VGSTKFTSTPPCGWRMTVASRMRGVARHFENKGPVQHTGDGYPLDPIPSKMLRFSTDDFPEHERLEAYREIYGRTIVRHDIEPIGDHPFHFEATLCSLPGLGLASSFISPSRRTHGPQHLGSDDVVLGLSLGGGCTVYQHGRAATIGKGEAVLTTCADPAVVVIPVVSRPVSLRIPNAIFRSRIADFDACLSRRIPRSSEGLLLAGYVAAMWNTDALIKPELRDAVVSHIHDLVCLMLGAKGDARDLAEQGGVRAARRSAILREIERRSGDAALSANTLARAFGITPRYVHLVLEETGKTFTHHLLQRRLEKAAAMLRDPLWRHGKIADIAVEAGFTDLSYFNRAFRRRFGATPSDVRETARGRK
jgi:AraC-like DNA-binding protein